MTAKSMVERVARAICAAEYGDESAGWENQVPAARAAIEAMRAPSAAMEAAAPSVGNAGEILDGWEAMISAALAED